MPRLDPKTSLGTPKPKPGTHLLYEPLPIQYAPPGTYNPNTKHEVEKSQHELEDFLEGQARSERNKKSGLDQFRRTTNAGFQRASSDATRKLGYNEEDNSRQLGYDQADLNNRLGSLGINFERDITDLSTAKTRGEQDYSRTLTNMQHEYGSKAEQQAQNAVQQGTDEAGTSTASAAVRGANQAFDKGNVDLSHNRAEEDLAQRVGRDTADYGRNVALANEGFGRQAAGLATNLGRAQSETKIGIQQTGQDATRAQHEATHAYHQTLGEYAEAASHATRKQGEYETGQGAASIYEAGQLHPGLKFPGGTGPNAPSQGPHAYAVGPGYAARPPKGINIGRSTRLTAPRY